MISALSLVHGRPALQFFCTAVADYIVKGVQGKHPTIEDVPDSVIRKSVEEVCSSNSVSLLNFR